MSNKELILILVLLIGFNISLKSQSIENLDKKNGFKEFKLGDPISKWKGNIIFNNSDLNIKYYIYNGNSYKKLFEYDIDYIALGFNHEQKLEVIQIVTIRKNKDDSSKGWTSNEYHTLKLYFENLFGKSTPEQVAKDENIITGWVGKKTILTLKYIYLGIKKSKNRIWSEDQCSVMISPKVNLNDQF